MKISVHWNFNKKLFAITAQEGPEKGRVIEYNNTVFLKDAQFKVSQAGRQRVLKEKQKNVHARIFGERISNEDIPEDNIIEYSITYNPYKMEQFSDLYGVPVFNADYVLCLWGKLQGIDKE